MLFKKKPKKDDAAGAAEGEAPEAGAEGAAEGAPAKKGPPLKLLIMAGVGAVLILGGGGAGAWFLFLKPKPAEAGHGGDAKGHAPKKPKKDKGGGHGGGGKPGEKDEAGGMVREGPDGVTFYTMPDLVVNIQSADGKPTFLKLKLTFEMKDHEAAEAIASGAPRLQDMFQSFLRELRPEDLNGSQGSYQLRMEILRRVNLLLAPHKVDAVLIEEMLIQ